MDTPDFYNTQKREAMSNNDVMPYMQSLYSCMNRIKGQGYTEAFEETSKGIYSINSNYTYSYGDYNIISFLRFQGNSIGTSIIMYIIETKDGLRGTLVKMYDGA